MLTYEEIVRTVRVAASLGVRKLRVTGGEPLTRRGVIGLIRQLAAVDGINDIGLSTNGTLLAEEDPEDRTGKSTAQRLVEAGCRTVNISLDTLDRNRYREITGRDYFDRVSGGIEAARAAGFEEIKFNTVLMRGVNDADLPALVDFALGQGALIRFIEMMPVSRTDVLDDENFLSTGEARRLIEAEVWPIGPASGLSDQRPGGVLMKFRWRELPACDQLNPASRMPAPLWRGTAFRRPHVARVRVCGPAISSSGSSGR